MTTTVGPLPPELTQHGSDPDLLGKELIDEITRAIAEHPRSQQVALGPSEIGHPCGRRIGYQYLGHPENPGQPNWKATVGTALHAWLEGVIDNTNQRLAGPGPLLGQERFLVEEDLICGTIGDQPLGGHCDLFDRVTGTVVDWKSVGPTQIKKYKAEGPGDQYRKQAHTYGRGWQLKGFDVQRVAVMFLPRNGELREHVWWTEPYDEQIALDAMERAAGILLATQLLGDAALTQLDTADAWCHMCPFYRANSTDLSTGCPGDSNRATHNAAQPFADLLAG